MCSEFFFSRLCVIALSIAFSSPFPIALPVFPQPTLLLLHSRSSIDAESSNWKIKDCKVTQTWRHVLMTFLHYFFFYSLSLSIISFHSLFGFLLRSRSSSFHSTSHHALFSLPTNPSSDSFLHSFTILLTSILSIAVSVHHCLCIQAVSTFPVYYLFKHKSLPVSATFVSLDITASDGAMCLYPFPLPFSRFLLCADFLLALVSYAPPAGDCVWCKHGAISNAYMPNYHYMTQLIYFSRCAKTGENRLRK